MLGVNFPRKEFVVLYLEGEKCLKGGHVDKPQEALAMPSSSVPRPVLAPPWPRESCFSPMTRLLPPAPTLLSPGGPTVTFGPTAPGRHWDTAGEGSPGAHAMLLWWRRRPPF